MTSDIRESEAKKKKKSNDNLWRARRGISGDRSDSGGDSGRVQRGSGRDQNSLPIQIRTRSRSSCSRRARDTAGERGPRGRPPPESCWVEGARQQGAPTSVEVAGRAQIRGKAGHRAPDPATTSVSGDEQQDFKRGIRAEGRRRVERCSGEGNGGRGGVRSPATAEGGAAWGREWAERASERGVVIRRGRWGGRGIGCGAGEIGRAHV